MQGADVGTTAIHPDTVRAALDRVFASGEVAWRETSSPFARLEAIWNDLMAWLGTLEAEHPVLHWLLIGALTLLALGLVAHLGYLTWRGIRSATARPPTVEEESTERRDAAWYMRRAAQLGSEGRYAEALGYRFMALILELDRRNALRFHPAKTPAEYAREVRLAPDAIATFRELVTQLYGYLFGGASPGAGDLASFDERARELGGRVAAS